MRHHRGEQRNTIGRNREYFDIYIYIYVVYVYIGGRDLSIPAYFIPAHVDGAWSKILGCCRCCCSAAWGGTASRDREAGIYQIIELYAFLFDL